MDSTAYPLNITYRRSRRAKYVRISVSPEPAVTVTVPQRVPLREAQAFVQTKEAWIRKHLRRMREAEQKRPALPELSDEALEAAQEALFVRLEAFSERFDLPYRRAAFRCQKTKWGSCSSQNNISLNINIAFLPEHLQDYILLHELCHIRHKNHSPAFWSLLDACCGRSAKALAKELKQHRMVLRP